MVDKTIRTQAITISIYAIFFICVSSIILYFVLRRFVLKSVSALSGAMEKVAEGNLKQTVNITSQDEMSQLANIFNIMTRDLNIAKEKMENWTQTLEDEVTKKTDELKKITGQTDTGGKTCVIRKTDIGCGA